MYIISFIDKNISRGEIMKKKLVLKPFVLPTLYITLIVGLMMFTAKSLYKSSTPQEKEVEQVSEFIFDDAIPVISADDVYILNPYSGDKVEEKIGYYNYQDDKEKQEKSIIQYENTYLQNTGITYTSEKEFNVIAIQDGKVTKVYENEILGNVVEITHEKIISVYQMVNNVKVKEGDEVKAGDIIATSGVSKLNEKGHNLHFEIIKDGINQDPKTIIGVNTKDI